MDDLMKQIKEKYGAVGEQLFFAVLMLSSIIVVFGFVGLAFKYPILFALPLLICGAMIWSVRK